MEAVSSELGHEILAGKINVADDHVAVIVPRDDVVFPYRTQERRETQEVLEAESF